MHQRVKDSIKRKVDQARPSAEFRRLRSVAARQSDCRRWHVSEGENRINQSNIHIVYNRYFTPCLRNHYASSTQDRGYGARRELRTDDARPSWINAR